MILTTIKKLPIAWAMKDIPMMANKRKIISPVTIPAITEREGINPEARDREMVANTPGPGVAARTNNAMARLKMETKLISMPLNSIIKVDFTLLLVIFKS